jgi:signal transduction histidine kinase
MVIGYQNIKIALSLIVFNVMFGAIAQNNSAIDSLNNVIKTAKEDIAKVNSLNALSFQYRKISDFKMSKKYAESALELAQTLGYNKGIFDSYGNTIQACRRLYCSDLLKIILSYLMIFEENGDEKGISSCHMHIGNMYKGMGNYPEALEKYLTSLKIAQEIGYKRIIAGSYTNIAEVYKELGNYPGALENRIAALKIFQEIGEKKSIASCFNDIGTIYSELGRNSEALEMFFASLEIKKVIGFKIGMANSYNNIGKIYQKEGNYSKAMKNHLAALKISEEIGHKKIIANSYNNIGETYLNQGSYPEARKYLEDGLALAKKIEKKLEIRDSYKSLSKLDSTEGKLAKALENYKMFTLYKDSLVNEKSKNKIDQMSILYEVEKKDREIELLNKDNEVQKHLLDKQKLLRKVIIAGVLLIFLVGLFVLRSFRLRKKLEKQQVVAMERKRISADLHDDVGSDLSRIMLLSELMKRKVKTNEILKEADNISAISQGVISKMGEIIWALNSKNDFLENMIAFIRRYAAEYFENSNVKLTIGVPDKIPRIPINAEKRRNIFYAVKEALHNIIKHAQATEAKIKFVIHKKHFSVDISDNGIGISHDELNRFGNGIKSMKDRMNNIGGKFSIEQLGGTKVRLSIGL